MIKAPYNFVPLPKDVFYPDWAEKISQDVPFKNQVSGSIEITVKAETPIFVRNGYAGNNKANSFSHTPDGKYFIPATTIKSCIRSVIEILSFGKMKPITNKVKNYEKSPSSLEKIRQSSSKIRQSSSAKKQDKPENSLDLAECMFGTVNDEQGLKGRIQFSNFMCHKPVDMPDDKKKLIYILNSPNPACKPTYLKSNGSQYFDYDSGRDAKEIMNGWKRYVLKKSADLRGKDKENKMTSTIMPLNKGSEFRGKIHFHNLLPQEFGALLCALTWNNESDCYHQIGQAKPYGYGRVSFTIDDVTKQSASQYIQSYKRMMNDWLIKLEEEETTWRNTENIKELFTLASYKAEVSNGQFQYMRSDDLKEAKNKYESLPLLSSILKKSEKDEPTFKDAKKTYKDNNEQLGRFTQIIEHRVAQSATQDTASLQDERMDIESYLLCKERVTEIVDAGILSDEITPEELVWMESVLRQFNEENDGDNTLLSTYADLIAPKKKEWEERLAKEEEEVKARMAEKEKEEQARLAQEKEEALKRREAERLEKNKAKSDWKKQEQQKVQHKATESPTSPSPQVVSLCEQLAKAPSVGQLTKMIVDVFKNEKRNQLSPEELNALTEGIRSVIKSLSAKMNKKDLESKGAWQANGSIWKKVADLVGSEAFVSAFPNFDNK